MLHLLYILAFTVLAVLAVSNMIRNLVRLGTEVQKPSAIEKANRPVPHPELLDNNGGVINEPLLVMRSISIKDAKEQLNALYESSTGSTSSGDDTSAEDS